MTVHFKVILWGGAQFPTGSKVCEELKNSRYGAIP